MLTRFDIDPGTPMAILRHQLMSQLACEVVVQRQFPRQLLDTLDWRLYKNGYQLSAEPQGHALLLQLHRLNDDVLISQALCPQRPNFIHDIPSSKLHQLLQPQIEQRRLLTQLSLHVDHSELTVTNHHDKTLARLQLESCRITAPKQVRQAQAHLIFLPLRGYPKQARRIHALLEQQPGLSASHTAALTDYLNTLRIDIHHFDNQASVASSPDQRSDQALKQALLHQLSQMRHHHQPVIDDIDAECLHDYRVAIRRSRTLVKGLPGTLPKSHAQRHLRQLKRLGELTTPVRDIDVILLNLDHYRALLPHDQHPGLAPVEAYLQRERERHHRQLGRQLTSRQHQQWISAYQRFLSQPEHTRTPLPNAKQPIRSQLSQHLWKHYQSILGLGAEISPRSPDEALHTLRKRCKQLRYLIEFGQHLYPTEKIQRIIVLLKKLQDRLGKCQDLHLQITHLGQIEQTLTQQGQPPLATKHALTSLVKQLSAQQQQCRADFLACFEVFASARHRANVKELFNP